MSWESCPGVYACVCVCREICVFLQLWIHRADLATVFFFLKHILIKATKIFGLTVSELKNSI